MLLALLSKDLRRTRRNPLPWLLNLALPLCITAMIGLIFGGNSEGKLGRIRFAVVDEDQSMLTRMMRGSFNQGGANTHLEPVFLEREEALRQLNKNSLSAALIIPTNFTRDYLDGAPVTIELVKNPAQSIHPTVIEELSGAAVTALNAISRNLRSEFPAWREAFQGDFDYRKFAGLIETTGDKLEAARKILNPPVVMYDRKSPSDVEAENEATSSQTPSGSGSVNPDSQGPTKEVEKRNAQAPTKPDKPAKKASAVASVFAYMLPGLSAMFLLILAGNAVTDVLRELRFRTFERYQTLRHRLLPFVVGKLVFAVVMLLLCSAIMLGGGSLIFGIQWTRPLGLSGLVFAYACFAAALMALFVAMLPDERRAGALTNISSMILGMAGGCMIPLDQLPNLLREHVAPLLPTAWFVDAARDLQFGSGAALGMTILKLLLTGSVLLAVTVAVFGRRFRAGARV